MRLTKINNLYQLSFMPNLFPVNCYLIEEDEYLIVIDAGLPFCKKAILKTAKVIGKPIKKIVLTHAHTDHVGALDGLTQELQDVEVLIPRRELKILQGDASLEEGEGNMPIKGGIPKNIKTNPDTLLQDGNRIGSLVAIHTPGHTPGMMSYLDVRDHSLIVGDALQTKGGIAVAGDIRLLFPFPAMATWNKEKAIESVENLVDYKPSLLAVGHGNLIKNPVKDMKQAIERAKRSLNRN